jgi:phosphohistidine phosphatase
MACTLILIRHAKSDWDDPEMDDHDRPLNPRGRRSAPRIGAWMAARGHVPEAVLCSTALRTRETWEGIATQLPGSPAPSLRRDLYLAEPETLLAAIRECDAACLAAVAHNPGIGELAAMLAQSPPAHPQFGLYPTGATLVLQFDGAHLADVAPGRGRVIDFVVPRELPDPP